MNYSAPSPPLVAAARRARNAAPTIAAIGSRQALRVVVAGLTLLLALTQDSSAQSHGSTDARLVVPVVSPWMDHHDRIGTILGTLVPEVGVLRVDLARSGGHRSLEWHPSFGTRRNVPLTGPLVILENAPLSGLLGLQDARGLPFDQALAQWVRSGGHLLIVGGSPSIESYVQSPIAELMGFLPDSDLEKFRKRRQRSLRGDGIPSGMYVEHLHEGRLRGARVLIEADGDPFLIENRVGRGRVTTLLSGAQGQLRPDGEESASEWFGTASWTETLRRLVDEASDSPHTVTPRLQAPASLPAPAHGDFDVRLFGLGNRPYPFALAPGEAHQFARRLRGLGFTSVVFYANYRRPEDDREVLREISDAGLEIVYYESIQANSSRDRFPAPPPRARGLDGKGDGWDIHDRRFGDAFSTMLEKNTHLPSLPLRGLQLIEEFQDHTLVGPSLEGALSRPVRDEPLVRGTPRWIDASRIQADATAETFGRIRAEGLRRFPDLPQATYWPGSYWSRPHHYAYRLTDLAEAVDEILAPGYGYDYSPRSAGPMSVRRSATEAWSALRDSSSSRPHLAIYALGRPSKFESTMTDYSLVWRETAWTALAHGATGLAYWALPRADIIQATGTLHSDIARIGPWLSAAPRTPAPVALFESWTSRAATRGKDEARKYAACLASTLDALELGFEDVDVAFEERLDRLPASTRALVLVSSPVISREAADALVAFIERGGHVFADFDSAQRVEPGNRSLDLALSSAAPDQVHGFPIASNCLGGHVRLEASARAWAATLPNAGIVPRAVTDRLDTEASVRGNSELAYLVLLNHGTAATRPTARLDASQSSRTWRALTPSNPGTPLTGATIRAPRMIEPGEADVWISVARPATTVSTTLANDATGRSARVEALDAEGRPVTDGYPLALTIDSKCFESVEHAVTLTRGSKRLQLGECPADELEQLSWTVYDPVTRVHYRSQEDRADEEVGRGGSDSPRNDRSLL